MSSLDLGDFELLYRQDDRLISKQAKMLRDREAVIKRAARHYVQGNNEAAKALILGYAEKLDDGKMNINSSTSNDHGDQEKETQ